MLTFFRSLFSPRVLEKPTEESGTARPNPLHSLLRDLDADGLVRALPFVIAGHGKSAYPDDFCVMQQHRPAPALLCRDMLFGEKPLQLFRRAAMGRPETVSRTPIADGEFLSLIHI